MIWPKTLYLQYIIIAMRAIPALILITVVLATPYDIYSRPIQAIYNPFGSLSSLQISWKPMANVCSHCYLQISLPSSVHISATPLSYSIYNENQLPLIQNGVSVVPTSNIYYFPVLAQLAAQIWYMIQINVATTPTTAFGLVGLSVVSGIVSSNIIYASNNALEYYYIEPIVLPQLNVQLTPVRLPSTSAAQTYPFELTFNSTYSSSQPVTITFAFTNQNYSLLSTATAFIQNNNFQMVGSCQIVCDILNCIEPLYCIVQSNQIKLSLSSLDSFNHTLSFTITNPNFVDTTAIAAFINDNNGDLKGIGIANNLFSVKPISIIAAGVNLHWGIPLSTVVTQMGLGVFIDGGWNTIEVGFTLSDITGIGSQFSLQVYVGASFVLQQSITTNIPNLNGTSASRCTYTSPRITCRPIDAFTSSSIRYFIAFKAYFSSTDNIVALGSINIKLIDVSSYNLFNSLSQTLNIPMIPWSDYHDYSGFHSSSNRISETQVIGTADLGLVNSTSTFMNKLFVQPAFIGIDPSIPNQQLIFLLKTLPSQMSLSLVSETYQMKLFINPKVFNSISPKGIDFAAFSQTYNSYREDITSCYVNSSTNPQIQIYQCQAYNDYVYGQQIDNIYTNYDSYAEYSFTCGNGKIVVCPSGSSCKQTCRIFKGKGTANADSGVFSLRNVNFIQNYQSSFLASNMTLDFIIVFYHAGKMVSASLLNAYTIKSARLSYMTPKFYNSYLSTTQTNDGQRIPTLLSLEGHLTIQEINSFSYDEFKIFITNQITTNKFIESEGRIGCSNECSSFALSASPFLCKDNWICKQGISIKGLTNLDTSISIKLPIQVLSPVLGSIDIALLFKSQIITVYRLNGSAVQQLLSSASPVLVQNKVYTTTWTNSNTWVFNSGDVYNQALNLNLITPLSTYNTIDYKKSVLTYSGSPSMTFTSIYESIFSSYSSAVVGTNSCDKPFTYVYNYLYNVSVLWCPLVNGAINPVNISYPLYPNNLGTGFPFSTMFAYSFSDGSGNMVAFRTQSSTTASISTCTTSHTTSYNYAQIIQQVISTTIVIPSIQLSPTTYTSIQFTINTPTAIPLTFQSCQVKQVTIDYMFACTMVTSSTSSATLQINYPATQQISVMQFAIQIVVVAAAAPSVSSLATYSYSYKVILPQTDNSGTVALFYGTTFSPYSSTVSSCSSIFSLMNVPASNQNIVLSNIAVTAIALKYLADLSFNVQFSTSRINLMSSSQIIIQFNNAVTTSLTSCSLWTPQNYFLQQIISSNTISLRSYDTIYKFSSVSYNVLCSNLLLQQNSPSVQVSWTDTGNTLQLSTPLSSLTNYLTSTSIAAVITSKNYNSLGFDSQYQITLSLSTNLADKVDIWFEVNNFHIHTAALQCYYSLNTIKTQIYCMEDWKGKVHLTFQAASSSTIIIWIYGIKQDTTASSSYQTLICINDLTYFTALISQTFSPNLVTFSPILLTNQLVTSSYCLDLSVIFPIAYSSVFYLQLDDFFLLASPQVVSCYINTVNYPCLRNTPNIVQVYSTFVFVANTQTTVQVCGLIPTNSDRYDPSRIYFKIFTLSGTTVSLRSYTNLNQPLLASSLSLFSSGLLQWSQTGLNTTWTSHILYIGYYGKQIYLSIKNQSVFNTNISMSYTSQNSISYLNSSTFIKMGTSQWAFDIAADSSLKANQIDYLSFSQSPLSYATCPYLNVFISSQPCQISLQYTIYDLYSSGITIPILLDFSNCRPAVTHYLNYTISSSDLIIDTTLTNQQLDSVNPQVYVVIRQSPTNSNLNGIFTLTTSLWGKYNTSYLPIPSIKIQVNTGTILQIPQSVYPVINQLNSSFVNLTVQCNQASTIYWVLGLYPTMLGITYEQIQAFLIKDLKGLRARAVDPLSWSHQIYGLDYEPSPNSNKNIVFDNLMGSSNYLFKYFCVNHLGYSSAAQILTFNTTASDYQLTKVTLTYPNQLTIDQANRIACYIAEVLLTPYQTVITSTFSNCINTSTTFFSSSNSVYNDGYSNNVYSYLFYINSLTTTSTYIKNNLSTLLSKYTPFVSMLLSSLNSITITPLTNNYDPIVQNKYLNSSTDVITFTVDVGVPNSYLVAGYLNTTFNSQNMSLPSQHLIKQGIFSVGSQFNQVYMQYGSSNISISIRGLQPHQNYSLFYYVTVDDPAINSKWTQVYYSNIQTLVYTFYDLSGAFVAVTLTLIFLLSL